MTKKGKKYINDDHTNFSVSYGTVDYTVNKSMYIDISSWLEPTQEMDADKTIKLMNKFIRKVIHENTCNGFDKNFFIVDLNLRESGIKLKKKSYMNINITLYNTNTVDVLPNNLDGFIKTLITNIQDKFSSSFSFNKKKN